MSYREPLQLFSTGETFKPRMKKTPSHGYERSGIESVELMMTCFWSSHSAEPTLQTHQEVTSGTWPCLSLTNQPPAILVATGWCRKDPGWQKEASYHKTNIQQLLLSVQRWAPRAPWQTPPSASPHRPLPGNEIMSLVKGPLKHCLLFRVFRGQKNLHNLGKVWKMSTSDLREVSWSLASVDQISSLPMEHSLLVSSPHQALRDKLKRASGSISNFL